MTGVARCIGLRCSAALAARLWPAERAQGVAFLSEGVGRRVVFQISTHMIVAPYDGMPFPVRLDPALLFRSAR